ncbi:LPLT family lysophospholipid transporter-like MFS transporter [Paludibacterium purpuratum]|uniref:LPLT family lysophospholipid transporter-like MFS transporter n=2 Tax=Paludibacterium purpuratum TaxID=1144873 RepID=A0A4R7B0K5_9NEIS|nr:LPLT family lysophospholipid transporter-like MFS transporter [Paludibacterium purpuratum]
MDLPLWSRGLLAVLAAQFLSAMADNALLFGALALLKNLHYPEWSAPLLQEFFVAAYILLAPFAGPLADALPKGRVMLLANGLKLGGALGMCLGLNPFLAYGLVGVGAATYSPAKYGILSELTSSDRLVKANGLMEGSTIAAILIGALAGGTLADWSVPGTLVLVALCYALAAGANLLIPRLAPAHVLERVSLKAILGDFRQVLGTLWRMPDTRFSIVGTSLFWGAGSTMRFLLVAWVPVALGIMNNRMPAYLNALVAVGIVVGAALAARFVTLEKVNRAMPAGVLIGVAVCLLAGTGNLVVALAIMLAIGGFGGFFVVPLNALLQERGHNTVGAGHAIAVQNLGENLAMLTMIGAYTLALRAGAPVTTIAAGFGLAMALAMIVLWRVRVRHARVAGKSAEAVQTV